MCLNLWGNSIRCPRGVVRIRKDRPVTGLRYGDRRVETVLRTEARVEIGIC